MRAKSHRRGENNVQISWLILAIWERDGMEVVHTNGHRWDLRKSNLTQRPRDSNPHVKKARAKRASGG